MVLLKQAIGESEAVSGKINQQLKNGSFYLALHFWLALHHQTGGLPGQAAQTAMLEACQKESSPRPALQILHHMLAASVSHLLQTLNLLGTKTNTLG